MRIHRVSLRCAIAVAASLFSHTAGATVLVLPFTPTPSDSVQLQVVDEFPSTFCWQIVQTECRFAAPDSCILTNTLQYCHGDPGCVCLAQPEAFTRSCSFGPLPPGDYKAVYLERHLNPADPRDLTPQSVVFTVVAPTPVLRRSWGRLKAIYR